MTRFRRYGHGVFRAVRVLAPVAVVLLFVERD
jgi:hypothetical protein